MTKLADGGRVEILGRGRGTVVEVWDDWVLVLVDGEALEPFKIQDVKLLPKGWEYV